MTQLSQDELAAQYVAAVRLIALGIYEQSQSDLSLTDLYGAGMAGLVHAAQSFDTSTRGRFADFARLHIRRTILDRLRSHTTTPWQLRCLERIIKEAFHTSATKHAGLRSNIDDAGDMDTQVAAHQQPVSKPEPPARIGPLQASRDNGRKEEHNVAQLLTSSKRDRSFDLNYIRMQLGLTDIISNLPEQEWLVMALHYYEETSVKEIGSILGISQSQVATIRASAISYVRNRLLESTHFRTEPGNVEGQKTNEH